jgi:hypothetical protein
MANINNLGGVKDKVSFNVKWLYANAFLLKQTIISNYISSSIGLEL